MARNLLIVGRDGNGKSSTANSILGEKFFLPNSSGTSGLVDIKTSPVNDRQVILTKICGLEYPSLDFPVDIEKTFYDIDKALNSISFAAVIVVLKYGVRFTKQEQDAILMIKSTFGFDVIKKHGVIVLTYGDSFKLDMEENDLTFEDWCRGQSGQVRELFDECGYRCVLFNNRTKDGSILNDQQEKLFSAIAKIQTTVDPYSVNDQKIKYTRNKIIVMCKLPELEKKTDEIINKIGESLSKLSKTDSGYKASLESLLKEHDKHKAYLQQEDMNTEVLKLVLDRMHVTQMRLEILIQMDEQTIKDEDFVIVCDSDQIPWDPDSQVSIYPVTATDQNNQGWVQYLTASVIQTIPIRLLIKVYNYMKNMVSNIAQGSWVQSSTTDQELLDSALDENDKYI
uniref:AIG1-type G domain-containing protein n=1 Tax=Arion vulgaris TaxID=1028688 RepID=A0A0B7A0L8_9EUPU